MSSESGEINARFLRDELELRSPPIDPFFVAKVLDIAIQEHDLGNQFDGCLLNKSDESGDTYGVFLNSSVNSEARKRFTLAHEIGHARLKHHKNITHTCAKKDIGIGSGVNFEKEANEFASELLMPADFIAQKLNENVLDIDFVCSIADICQTSLTGSALRCINYTPELAALIVSESGEIKYSIPSFELKDRKLSYKISKKLHKHTLAHSIINSSQQKRSRDNVDVTAWFPGLDYGRYSCVEDSISLPNYNQVLTLISLEENYEDEELFI